MTLTIAEAIKEFVESAEGPVASREIKDAVNSKYPGLSKPSTIQTYLYACVVNQPKAYIHYPSVPKFLFKNTDNKFELYSEAVHGPNTWAPIAKVNDASERQYDETADCQERIVEDRPGVMDNQEHNANDHAETTANEPTVQLVVAPASADWTARCPVCRASHLRERTSRGFLGIRRRRCLQCPKCGALFIPHDKGYRLEKCADKSFAAWRRYRGRTLTTREWARVATGGVSDAEQREVDEVKQREAQRQAREEHGAIKEAWLRDLQAGYVQLVGDTATSSVLLKHGETRMMSAPGVRLAEPHPVRHTFGEHLGSSFPAGGGVRVSGGIFSSRSVSEDEVMWQDSGDLVVTNMRLMFTGHKRAISEPLGKVMHVDAYLDGIRIGFQGKSKMKYFCFDPKKPPSFILCYHGREYKEPFTGMILKLLIETLIRQHVV